MRSSKKRSRSNQNRPRSLGNIVNRVFDSSGPEGKVRGTPQQIIEKYQTLARDAQLSNDRVAAENFLQHAEHYTRMLAEAQRELAVEQEARQQQYQQTGTGQSSGNQNGGNQSSGNQNGGQYGNQNGGNRDNRERGERDNRNDRGDRFERNDGRNDSRNDNRGDNRGEGRNENRADGRNENRNDSRNEPRGEGRSDGREPRHQREDTRQPDLISDVIDFGPEDGGLVDLPERGAPAPAASEPVLSGGDSAPAPAREAAADTPLFATARKSAEAGEEPAAASAVTETASGGRAPRGPRLPRGEKSAEKPAKAERPAGSRAPRANTRREADEAAAPAEVAEIEKPRRVSRPRKTASGPETPEAAE